MKINKEVAITIGGIVGLLAAAGMAIRQTPRALTLMDEEMGGIGVTIKDVPSTYVNMFGKKKFLKMIFKQYRLPITVGGLALGTIVFGQYKQYKILQSTSAALAASDLTRVALQAHKEAVMDVVDEKTQAKIDEAYAERVISANPPIMNPPTPAANKVLCYDAICGGTYESNKESIREAVNNINDRLFHGEMYLPFSWYCSDLNMNQEYDYAPSVLYWTVDDAPIAPVFNSTLIDGVPYMLVDFNVRPHALLHENYNH